MTCHPLLAPQPMTPAEIQSLIERTRANSAEFRSTPPRRVSFKGARERIRLLVSPMLPYINVNLSSSRPRYIIGYYGAFQEPVVLGRGTSWREAIERAEEVLNGDHG